ncbi:DUF192 domain-containing protein [Maritalea mediterranea]|uniref:DUF192 domain-containing protein n=1 Tax=Maritalea mediterranea TaxID=2909667 RepID=A0ABS9E603_9HYPH|nr:DUF192 domain-containing protein [Maritalea mediterranea]MCF4098237.1 DUF192 domain-containing protein [Maritalea mediterranea]
MLWNLAQRSVKLLGVIFLALALSGCWQSDNKVVLRTDLGDIPITVEVVDTPESRRKGLMFRTKMPRDEGMLFDFKESREVSFWMRNTFIPLDMIFIDEQGVIKHIHQNAIPQDPTAIPSKYPVRFVLEINGGLSSQYGLKPGDQVRHPRMNG